MNFLKGVEKSVTDPFETIGTGAKNVVDGIGHSGSKVVNTLYNDSKSVVSSLHKDAKGITKGAYNLGQQGIGVFDNLTNPMTIMVIGAVVVVVLLSRN